ncbi:unnamed protein product [Rhizoctonia solani]|uniref:Uncharacterized protein n=1 Tax=Rhizoctonia solani TaxID=456999 RepID=A0A8H2ZX98_9AGAM|nr:unnamed protein product [Rhizoctonia solani]
MSSEKVSSVSDTPAWSTGPDQIEVELVVTGEIILTSIANYHRLQTEGLKFESPFGLTGCSSRDFERALTFCAEDRACTKPPSKELAHIINETAVPSIIPPSVSPEPKHALEASTSAVQKGFADMTIADEEDDDDDDESYSPSESDASDSGDEYSDTDMADFGTAGLKAERDEHNTREKEKRLLGL